MQAKKSGKVRSLALRQRHDPRLQKPTQSCLVCIMHTTAAEYLKGALRPGLGCECLASRTGVREPRAPFGVARRESPANTCCANDWQQARTTVPNESESPPTEKLYRREFRRGRVNPRTLLWHALWAPLLAAHAAGAAAYGNANGFCLCVLMTGAQLGQDTSRGAAS